ncbi:hypothetical protein [Acinetobacter baumannii]|uniref:hypothetical protein n=1 Tax=Acinetobacter baumannii TaxID=470 RepID=UPI0003F84AAB|nr:hypothetical protein [Acinetobacter baumannii]EKU2509534.1 hypothetical protein [Acinetobacter baumannii]NAS45217.1 hypothetical protein [Acinetobacter baumannii]RSP24084.1 hypothetical protein EA735_15090 [Acinetobacter baumannii]HBN3185487.1 hypothetical protein [Acinetobacter baumannii]HBN3954570.1 hypothetical protein [Acinetobacter baumannii]
MEKTNFIDEYDLLFREMGKQQILSKIDENFSFDLILEKIKKEKNTKVIEVLNCFIEQTFKYLDLNELQYGYGYLIGFLNSSKDNLVLTSDEFNELGRIGKCCYLAATARINHEKNLTSI